MVDRKAGKMTLWQCSQEEASSRARGRDGGTDKQMLFITQGWWGWSVCGLVHLCVCVCLRTYRVVISTRVFMSNFLCKISCNNVSVCNRACTLLSSVCACVHSSTLTVLEGEAPTKGICQGEPKTTKVTLPLVMYFVYRHCSGGKSKLCVYVCVYMWGCVFMNRHKAQY